jgi:hypothetical protein
MIDVCQSNKFGLARCSAGIRENSKQMLYSQSQFHPALDYMMPSRDGAEGGVTTGDANECFLFIFGPIFLKPPMNKYLLDQVRVVKCFAPCHVSPILLFEFQIINEESGSFTINHELDLVIMLDMVFLCPF